MSESTLSTSAESQSELAYRALETLIVTMKLAPSELVTEQSLANLIGMGRTPVREAIQRLASEHLIEVIPRRGLRIPPIDLRRQSRLLELRKVLEDLVASQAAKRANRAARDEMRQLAYAFRNEGSGDYDAFLSIDHAFNQAVASMCDNEFAIGALQKLHGLSRRFWHYYSGHEEDLAEVADIHANIAEAIADGDPKAASAAVRVHMQYIQRFTLTILSQ